MAVYICHCDSIELNVPLAFIFGTITGCNTKKRLICNILFICLCVACAPKQVTVHSVPVLLNYNLYYPDDALERGLEGRAIVSLLVTEDGRTRSVKIYKSSGYHLLDSAAVRTAETFVFSPAMVRNKPVRSSVIMPVEFKLRDIDCDTWINEVFFIQKKIDCWYRSEDIEELYNYYKKMIYSTRFTQGLAMNEYIKDAVLDTTARLWNGYWLIYPASSILFIDIMYRYPESFTSLRARADFNKFFTEEATRIRHSLSLPKADTIIRRLLNAVKE